MPAGVLFPAATSRSDLDMSRHRHAVESNIRMVEFFMQIFGETLPAPAFQGFVTLALTCVADPALPLRQATILFKRSSESVQELEKLREALEADPRCEVRDYADDAELGTQIRATFEGWFRLVHP